MPSLLCLYFVCTVRDFSAAEKDRGMKFCTRARVRLLSGQVLFHFGELWLAWSHGGTHYFLDELYINRSAAVGIGRRGLVGIRNWGRRCSVRPCGGICVLQAC